MLNYNQRNIILVRSILNDLPPDQLITLLVMEDKLEQFAQINEYWDEKHATVRVEGPFLKILTKPNDFVITDEHINIKNIAVNPKLSFTSRMHLMNLMQIGIGLGVSSGCIYSKIASTSLVLTTDSYPCSKAFLEQESANFPPPTNKCFCNIPLNRLNLSCIEDVMAVVQKFDPEQYLTVEYVVDDKSCTNFFVQAKVIKPQGEDIEIPFKFTDSEGIKVIAPKDILSIRDYSF